MRLLKIWLRQFRRFSSEQTLDLNEDLIALVGPNEAGKSSILDALELLGSRTLPDSNRDVTRNGSGPAEIEGLFALDLADKQAISGIHDADKVTHARMYLKSDASNYVVAFEPRPMRDRAPRRECAVLLSALEHDPILSAQYSQSEHLQWDGSLFEDAQLVLASDRDSLSTESVSTLQAVADRLADLREADLPDLDEDATDEARDERAGVDEDRATREAARSAAIDGLHALVVAESEDSPIQQVLQALRGTWPSVAVFRPEDRELESAYAFDDVVDQPPPALRNLCSIAELDLAEVRAARDAGKTGHVEKLFENANARLKARYLQAWNQSNVYPRFGAPHQGTLSVWIATEGDESYSEPYERSDGLRWFIALHSFLMALGTQQPILVVDEAETHLHYDAQADLIDTLMRQRRTAKVVYSTHSVGCLPPDLGRGIRAVLAEKDTERSSIENSYWSIGPDGDRVGYTPVLFAMGANLLALTVPRYAVVTEGPSDAVLLPTLLREASGLDVLPYRIVPGLSDISDPEKSSISVHAGAVVCLTDGDDPGLKRLEQIRKSNELDDTCLMHLGLLREGATLEDLVPADVFVAAVQAELETWAIQGLSLDGAVPEIGRWNWLKDQGSDDDGDPIADRLSKVRVAQRVVDLRMPEQIGDPARQLVDPSLRGEMNALQKSIVAALGITDDDSNLAS